MYRAAVCASVLGLSILAGCQGDRQEPLPPDNGPMTRGDVDHALKQLDGYATERPLSADSAKYIMTVAAQGESMGLNPRVVNRAKEVRSQRCDDLLEYAERWADDEEEMEAKIKAGTAGKDFEKIGAIIERSRAAQATLKACSGER
jgi:hypothetical protein